MGRRQAPTYAKRVDGNQKEIIADLESCGYTVYIVGQPVDILVGHQAKNFLFEIKMPGEKPRTPAQRLFLRTWPGQVRIIETAEEAIEVMTHAYKKTPTEVGAGG